MNLACKKLIIDLYLTTNVNGVHFTSYTLGSTFMEYLKDTVKDFCIVRLICKQIFTYSEPI